MRFMRSQSSDEIGDVPIRMSRWRCYRRSPTEALICGYPDRVPPRSPTTICRPLTCSGVTPRPDTPIEPSDSSHVLHYVRRSRIKLDFLAACRLGNLRQDFAQRRANGIVRIEVVWVSWRTFSVEMGPLFHPSSPFNVGFADKFFKAIVGGENLLAVVRQG